MSVGLCANNKDKNSIFIVQKQRLINQTSFSSSSHFCLILARVFQSLLIYSFAVYIYPERVVGYDERWAEDVGWCVAVTPLLMGVVLGALHALFKGQGNLVEVRSGLPCK